MPKTPKAMPEARCDLPIEQPPSSSFGAEVLLAPAVMELEPPPAALLPPVLDWPPVGSGATSARAVAVPIKRVAAESALTNFDILIL